MRRTVLLAFAALTLAVVPAAAQTTPRRPPADTLRFGATRPAAGDSIQMAEYEEDEAESDTIPVVEEASDIIERERPKPGPYSRSGGSGPFSVQASGEPSASRPERGEVVWLDGRAARPAAADSARRDTARPGASTRVAAGSTARRDSASSTANRPARRDSVTTTTNRPARDTASASTANRPARRDTASAPSSSRVARRDTSAASRPAARDTARRTSSGTAGASSTTGRTTTGASGGSAAARPRTHTIEAGETFYALARRYGVTAAQLRAVNPDVVMDSLEIGDVLRLPAAARDSRASGSTGSAGSAAQRPATTPRPSSSTASTQRRTHTVVAGETLFGIARRYGVSANAIREANEMETDQVRTGQRLVIPPAR